MEISLGHFILSSQVVSLPLQSANFCAAMDTLIDQDGGIYVQPSMIGIPLNITFNILYKTFIGHVSDKAVQSRLATVICVMQNTGSLIHCK